MGTLDLKMDGEEKDRWPLKLQDVIFPQHAIWAQICMRLMYPVIYRPTDPEREFVLIEHAYSVFEGPVLDPAYTEFHTMCILAPRVALLMRYECLPQIVEEPDENLRAELKAELARSLSVYPDPDEAMSVLHDLSVAKPRNTYFVDDAGIPNLQLIGAPTSRISFLIFALEKHYVDTINSVILEEAFDLRLEAFDLPLIAYKTQHGLKLAIEAYLSRPVSSGTFAMKRTLFEEDPKIVYIKKLAQIASQLGSTVTAVYEIRFATK